MEHMNAVRALSALGHESRLAIFRLLVQAGPEGMAAGAIARQLDLAPSALTFHLKDLTHADLVESRASGRYVIYSALYSAMTALVSYLTENCCSGVPCDASGTSLQRRRAVADPPVRTVASRRKAAGNRIRKGTSRSKK
jgi:ArsR family transcriptional regulator, arsenate/arsenite/antimonite-responsive transcriptional repressor